MPPPRTAITPARTGAILLECLLALALLFAAFTTIMAILASAAAQLERRMQVQEATEVATTALALLETSQATPETLAGPAANWRQCQDRYNWNLIIDSQPDTSGDLILTTISLTLESPSTPSNFSNSFSGDTPPLLTVERYIQPQPISALSSRTRPLAIRRPRHSRPSRPSPLPPSPSLARLLTLPFPIPPFPLSSRIPAPPAFPASLSRRGFTLLELMLGLLLIGAIIALSFTLYFSLLSGRTTLQQRAQHIDERRALLSLLDRALISACASDGTHYFTGEPQSILIPTRAALPGTPSGLTAYVTISFSGTSLFAAWNGQTPAPLLTNVQDCTFTYLHQSNFVDSFHASSTGCLPAAVQVIINFVGGQSTESADLHLLLSIPDSASSPSSPSSASSRVPSPLALLPGSAAPSPRQPRRQPRRTLAKRPRTARASILLALAFLIVLAAAIITALAVRIGNATLISAVASQDHQLRAGARSAIAQLLQAAALQREDIFLGQNLLLPPPSTIGGGLQITFSAYDAPIPASEIPTSPALSALTGSPTTPATSLAAKININTATPAQLAGLLHPQPAQAPSLSSSPSEPAPQSPSQPTTQPPTDALSPPPTHLLAPAPANGYFVIQDWPPLSAQLLSDVTTHSWDHQHFIAGSPPNAIRPRMLVGSQDDPATQETLKRLDLPLRSALAPLLAPSYQQKSLASVLQANSATLITLEPTLLAAVIDGLTDALTGTLTNKLTDAPPNTGGELPPDSPPDPFISAQPQAASTDRDGVIDILRASLKVLATVQGITPAQAEKIISQRTSLSGQPTLAFLITSGIFSPAEFLAVAPSLSVRSLQWGVRITVSFPTQAQDSARPSSSQSPPPRSLTLLACIDVAESPPRLLSLCELPFDAFSPAGQLIQAALRPQPAITPDVPPPTSANLLALPLEDAAPPDPSPPRANRRTLSSSLSPREPAADDSLSPAANASDSSTTSTPNAQPSPAAKQKWGRFRAPPPAG